jgi:hypothetical protein
VGVCGLASKTGAFVYELALSIDKLSSISSIALQLPMQPFGMICFGSRWYDAFRCFLVVCMVC